MPTLSSDRGSSASKVELATFMQNLAIRHKLVLIIMVTCLIALMVAGVAFMSFSYSQTRREMVKNLKTQAQMIAENCKAAITFDHADDAAEVLTAFHIEPSIVLACIHDTEGELFATYRRGDAGPAQALLGVKPVEGYRFADRFLIVTKLVQDENGATIIGTVTVWSDLEPLKAMFQRSFLITTAVLLLASFIAYLISSKVQGVICHEHVGHPREWSLEEQDFAASIADMITLKLEVLERMKVQQALRTSELSYRTLLANIPQKIIYKDLDCNFLLANASYARDLNMEVETLGGMNDYDFHPLALAEKYVADDKRIMEAGVDEEFEDVYRVDGKELIVQMFKSPVRDENGEVIGIFAIFWDITERKAAEDAIAQLNLELEANVQELQRSNTELQDFAYVTAHDLKAPLRAIGTLTDWVYADYADVFEEQGREQMQLVKSRVVRMNELIDSILRYSEIGRGTRNFRKIDVETMLAETIVMIEPPESINIVIGDRMPQVIAEKGRLIQVFQNLIGNGIKFMDKPKGRIEVGCRDEGGYWQFHVEDNGPGIDPKYHEKVFRMFQTLTPRDEMESTGIGLAVVKKIVELYGGKVWLESPAGAGLRAVFTLPKIEVPAEIPTPEAIFDQSMIVGSR